MLLHRPRSTLFPYTTLFRSQRMAYVGPRQASTQDAEHERAARAHAAGLGRGEQPAIEAANHKQKQHQRRPDVADAFDPLVPRSEERRVGKEGRSWMGSYGGK